jgi:cytochrome c
MEATSNSETEVKRTYPIHDLESFMIRQMFVAKVQCIVAIVLLLAVSVNAVAEVDVAAARKLAQKNNCFKCHAADKEKDGPSYRQVAEKYRGKAEGEEKVLAQITTGKMAKFPDGHEEEHRAIDTKDTEEIKNLVNWILSL